MRKHDSRCERSKTKRARCRCSCGGRKHGELAQVEQLEAPGMMPPELRVVGGLAVGRLESGYVFHRRPDGTLCAYVVPAGIALEHVAVHSPTGFEVGYSGSGPADLALSILARALGAPRDGKAYLRPEPDENPAAERAWALHQDCKRELLAGVHLAPGESHFLGAAELETWLQARP